MSITKKYKMIPKRLDNEQDEKTLPQPFQIAALAHSSSSLALASSSRARFRRLISCSRMARSYARCSSVRLGGLMPSAPAIIRPATTVCFSGRRAGGGAADLPVAALSDARLDEGLPLVVRYPGYPAAAAAASHGWEVCGEMGVGGGASGPSVFVDEGEMDVLLLVTCSRTSRSVSEPEVSESESTSSSQESATAASFFFFFCFIVVGAFLAFAAAFLLMVASGRGTSSCSCFLLSMERSLMDDSSSSVAV